VDSSKRYLIETRSRGESNRPNSRDQVEFSIHCGELSCAAVPNLFAVSPAKRGFQPLSPGAGRGSLSQPFWPNARFHANTSVNTGTYVHTRIFRRFPELFLTKVRTQTFIESIRTKLHQTTLNGVTYAVSKQRSVFDLMFEEG